MMAECWDEWHWVRWWLDTIITSGKHKFNKTGLGTVGFYNKNLVMNYNNITGMVL